MKIAIHSSKWGFSIDWISYCERNNIHYKIVDCYSSEIIQQIQGCDVLLWHHHHALAKDKVFAKQLLFAVQQSGLKVFPDFNSGWHFDDKLGQKYLLEAIKAPLVPTYVFYDKISAINWVNGVEWPKVFKLRGGAGSSNVKLVYSKSQAKKLINTAFGTGFPLYDRLGDLKENYRKFALGKTNIIELLKSLRRVFKLTEFAKLHGPERGYVLFQEFIPNNKFDIRVITIDNKAFGIKRYVRENDFRASGSGFISYDRNEIDERCIKIAFETTDKIKSQCVAYDFVFNEKNEPLIVEINYGFAHEAYFPCQGYWDKGLNWFAEPFNPTHWIIEMFIKKFKNEYTLRESF